LSRGPHEGDALGIPAAGLIPPLANEKAAFWPLFALCDLRHNNIRGSR
jgi:hypothetical protein